MLVQRGGLAAVPYCSVAKTGDVCFIDPDYMTITKDVHMRYSSFTLRLPGWRDHRSARDCEAHMTYPGDGKVPSILFCTMSTL